MALDFEKLKAASWSELAAIALCEFSRFVDAVERIAPDAAELQLPATEPAPAAAPPCPHPTELRANVSVMGQEPFSSFRCGVCHEVVSQQPVGA